MNTMISKRNANQPQILDDKFIMSWSCKDSFVYKVISFEPIEPELARKIQTTILNKPVEKYGFTEFHTSIKEGYFENSWKSNLEVIA